MSGDEWLHYLLYLVLPLILWAVFLVVVFDHCFPGPTDEEIGFCPDGKVHDFRSEYAYDNAGGDYMITSCTRCGR